MEVEDNIPSCREKEEEDVWLFWPCVCVCEVMLVLPGGLFGGGNDELLLLQGNAVYGVWGFGSLETRDARA